MPSQQPAARYTFSEDASRPGYLSIGIPAWRPRLATLFLPGWICVWLIGEVASLGMLFRLSPADELGAILFFGFWSIVWTCGGLHAIYSLAWVLGGREIITLSPDTLSVRREVAGFGRTRCYGLGEIRGLRVEAFKDSYPPNVRASMDACGLSGSIAFEHGGKVRRFGLGLNEEEAYAIVTPIAARI